MNKKLNEITFKDLKESPYFVLGCFIFVILLVVALVSYSIYAILDTKAALVDTRESYQTHLQEIATLKELRSQSQKAEEQLSAYKEVLPDSLGDVFVHAEGTEQTCKNFGLTLVNFQDPMEETSDTKETIFNITVEGSFTNIVSFMQYISTLKQIHRIDAINLTASGDALYTAELTIVILSQDGSTGIIAPVE